MSSERFEASLPFVLRWEGGYVNHRNDPGGPTNKGVTQAVYDKWRLGQQLQPRDVRSLEDAEMRAIYEAGYWIPPRCHLLNNQLDLVHFDTAVNMGVGRAVRFLQGVVGCKVDGDFGSGTERAVAGCDHAAARAAYCDAREKFYQALVARDAKYGVFLKGWLNRLNALRKEVKLPVFEGVGGLDFGDAPYIYNISELPDIPGLDR